MKVLVGEHEGFNNYPELCKELNKIRVKDDIEIVSGDPKSLSIKYAKENNLKYYIFTSKWNDMSKPCKIKKTPYGKYNSLAMLKRNIEMVDFVSSNKDYRIILFDNKKDKCIKHLLEYSEENDLVKTSIFYFKKMI